MSAHLTQNEAARVRLLAGVQGCTAVGIEDGTLEGRRGRRIYFGTLSDLIEPLEEVHAARQLEQRLRALTHPALLVMDKIGYLTGSANGARLFSQLINGRNGRASTELTSNKSFEECGEILHDEVMAAALLDRLLHRCQIVNIRGNRYRMRHRRELSKAIHPTAAGAASAEQAQITEQS